MPAVSDGGSVGCSQMAWTLMASVSTGLIGVSLASQTTTLPVESTSSIFNGALGADLSQ